MSFLYTLIGEEPVAKPNTHISFFFCLDLINSQISSATAIDPASGDSKDNTIGSISGSDDSKDVTSASVSYAVASGVTAILGYTSVDASDEGADSTDGSAWYIGANMAF